MPIRGPFGRPAKRYARELGPWLLKSHGSSPLYTEAQIPRGLLELRLDARYIAFGFAAFLGAKGFNALRETLPIKLSYDEAIAEFRRFLRPAGVSSSDAGESTVDPSDVAASLDFRLD
jgi:hypothetical protein